MDNQSEKEARDQVSLVVIVGFLWIFSEAIVDFLISL